MKVLADSVVLVQCTCGKVNKIHAGLVLQPVAYIVEDRAACGGCDKVFYMHIQEVRNAK